MRSKVLFSFLYEECACDLNIDKAHLMTKLFEETSLKAQFFLKQES